VDEITTIRVSKETKLRLMNHGKMIETMDDLLNRILDNFEKKGGKNER